MGRTNGRNSSLALDPETVRREYIEDRLNEWVGLSTPFPPDAVRDLIWALAMDPELERKLVETARAEREDLAAERRAVDEENYFDHARELRNLAEGLSISEEMVRDYAKTAGLDADLLADAVWG